MYILYIKVLNGSTYNSEPNRQSVRHTPFVTWSKDWKVRKQNNRNVLEASYPMSLNRINVIVKKFDLNFIELHYLGTLFKISVDVLT